MKSLGKCLRIIRGKQTKIHEHLVYQLDVISFSNCPKCILTILIYSTFTNLRLWNQLQFIYLHRNYSQQTLCVHKIMTKGWCVIDASNWLWSALLWRPLSYLSEGEGVWLFPINHGDWLNIDRDDGYISNTAYIFVRYYYRLDTTTAPVTYGCNKGI